jgi:hypothetical protein
VYTILTGAGEAIGGAGVTEAASVMSECCNRLAAAARSPGRISPLSTSARRILSGRQRRKMALKRMLASRGRRDCISANNAHGRRSPSGGISKSRNHCWKGEAVKHERRASLTLNQPGSGKYVKYWGPISFDLAFTRCKLTSPGLCVMCHRALRFRKSAQNGAVPAIQ